MCSKDRIYFLVKSLGKASVIPKLNCQNKDVQAGFLVFSTLCKDRTSNRAGDDWPKLMCMLVARCLCSYCPLHLRCMSWALPPVGKSTGLFIDILTFTYLHHAGHMVSSWEKLPKWGNQNGGWWQVDTVDFQVRCSFLEFFYLPSIFFRLLLMILNLPI